MSAPKVEKKTSGSGRPVKRRTEHLIPRIEMTPQSYDCHRLLVSARKLVRDSGTTIEKKSDGKTGTKVVFVIDQDVLQTARGLLSATKEFRARIVVNGSCPITSNVVSGAFGLSPRVSAEWTALAGLFDEYRVDRVRYTFATALVAGNTGSNWIGGGFAVANDYNSSTAPTSYVEVLSHAESDFMPIAGGFVIGSTSTNATTLSQQKHVWNAFPPWEVESAAAGTIATASWVETNVDWPGSVLIYGGCNGTNSDVPLLYYTEFFVRLRQRR